MAKASYNDGKLRDFVNLIITCVTDGGMTNVEEIISAISIRYGLDEKECANCGASMREYVYTLDCLDALLILGMGKIVKKNLGEGMSFENANRVHLQSELNQYYSVPSRSTQCSKLGLITKVKTFDGKHDTGAGWLITKRGFALLRGEPVPKHVAVWRNAIQERFADVITISEAFDLHRDKVARAISKRMEPKSDYRAETDSYSSNEWVEFGKLHEGVIL